MPSPPDIGYLQFVGATAGIDLNWVADLRPPVGEQDNVTGADGALNGGGRPNAQ